MVFEKTFIIYPNSGGTEVDTEMDNIKYVAQNARTYNFEIRDQELHITDEEY